MDETERREKGMSEKYGPTIENINLLHNKAKSKKDGVYSFRGLLYRVKNGRFTHFAHRNEVFERSGYFNVTLGFTLHAKKMLGRL